MRREEIIEILHRIEKAEDIEILYACEAGSRVLGFANDESDYDIRFIYKKLNVKDYLALNEQSEVIECIGEDIDIVGWDIKKALKLHYKNNPNLREWIISREVYMDKGIEFIFSGLGGFEMDIRDAVINLIDFHKGKGDLSERTVFILNNFILDSLASMKTTETKSFKTAEDYDERFRELLLVCR